jgi:hypothetical protein
MAQHGQSYKENAMAGKLTISTLNNDTGSLATQNGMTGIAKAWVNFNGNSTPLTINNSFNVSSITRVATGVFDFTMTSAMPNSNYAICALNGGGTSLFLVRDNSDASARTATSFRLNFATISGPADANPVNGSVAVFSS